MSVPHPARRLRFTPIHRVARGMSGRLRCAKLSRYNTWLSRGLAVNYDTSEVVVYTSADATSIAHTYSLLAMAKVERVVKDDRQLRVRFRSTRNKDVLFRFDDPADADKFCMLTHFAAHDLEFAMDCHWDEGAHPCGLVRGVCWCVA